MVRAALALVAFSLAGCMADDVDLSGPRDAPLTLVLEFTLRGEGESSPGPHCGTARLEGNSVMIERREDALDGERPLLVVLPNLEGAWATTGSEGYPQSLPANISTGIPNETDSVVQIGWSDDGPTLNGVSVALPHNFTAADPQGEWTATGTLRDGPDHIRLFTQRSCE